MSTFTELMGIGEDFLKKSYEQEDKLHNLEVALIAFEDAERMTKSATEKIKALQKQAIVLRLQKKYTDALGKFNRAIKLVKKNTLRHASLLRDRAMIDLERGKIDLAKDDLEESCQISTNLGKNSETGATIGFMGRVMLAQGKRDYAIKTFSLADTIMTDSKPKNHLYVRNNLRYWAKAQPWNLKLWLRLVILSIRIRIKRSQ